MDISKTSKELEKIIEKYENRISKTIGEKSTNIILLNNKRKRSQLYNKVRSQHDKKTC